MKQALLNETMMIRARPSQVELWRTAATREGYWSLTKWLRDVLDEASGGAEVGEVVADEKAIVIYVPSRAEDRRPFVIELARYESTAAQWKLLKELTGHPWCGPKVLWGVVAELARADAGRGPRETEKPSRNGRLG